jgi:hypothetical protein
LKSAQVNNLQAKGVIIATEESSRRCISDHLSDGGAIV